MKLNKFLMAFAAVAMVGCSSEDVMDFSANQAPEDSRMIQLDENFAIAGVSTDDGVTRTHWEQSGTKLVNKFLPILNADAAVDDVLDTKVDKFDQAVGLCWLGQTPGAEVYTNYQFYHFGWLKQGEDNATIECTKLTNGAWYDEIKFTAANAAGEADQTKFAFVDPLLRILPLLLSTTIQVSIRRTTSLSSVVTILFITHSMRISMKLVQSLQKLQQRLTPFLRH